MSYGWESNRRSVVALVMGVVESDIYGGAYWVGCEKLITVSFAITGHPQKYFIQPRRFKFHTIKVNSSDGCYADAPKSVDGW